MDSSARFKSSCAGESECESPEVRKVVVKGLWLGGMCGEVSACKVNESEREREREDLPFCFHLHPREALSLFFATDIWL